MSLTTGNHRNQTRKAAKLRFPQSWAVRFTIVVIGAVLSWWWGIRWVNSIEFAGSSTRNERLFQMTPFFLFQAASLILTVCAIYMFFSGLKRLGKFGNVLSIFLAVPFSVYVWNALLSDWFGSGRGGLAPWLIGIVPIAAILLYPLPIMRMKREAVALVGEGDYEGALRISRRWLRSKPYGRPFQGWILLEAGQYSEGQELLKDSAFDEKGMPRLTNVNLFFYAAALLNQGKNAEAQVLLEAAIGVPQKEDYFHSCLAECLLTQNKETNRACEILDSVTKALKKRPNPDQVRAFLSQCIALHAWALASCGRMAEASVRLQDAFEQSCELKKKELAELMHLKGVVCLTLGDREGAKASFRETLALFPHGSTGVLARKRLEGMGEDV